VTVIVSIIIGGEKQKRETPWGRVAQLEQHGRLRRGEWNDLKCFHEDFVLETVWTVLSQDWWLVLHNRGRTPYKVGIARVEIR
jgi:hypothetical protein